MAGYDRALYHGYLRTIPMFASCTDQQIDHLAQLGDAVTVADGHEIVREGDPGDTFFVIESGKVRVVRHDHEVRDLKPGAYFGELALFDPAPRNATIVAVGTVSLVSLTRSAFTAALDEMPAMRDTILQGMARRIHELDARV